ncbi:MAG TPA: phospholipid carrier-dependent glycosyltransferase [Bacteroidia bacterium]
MKFELSDIKHPFTIVSIILTVSFILFIQFYHLGELPIVQWDESRLAVNAAEMSINKNWMVTHFEGQADLYNTKPPLMIWLQTLSIYIFGLNEFAIRFPSALAGALCILFCGFQVYLMTKSIWFGMLSSILLTLSYGFIQLHGTLTGDYDSLLALFVFLSFAQLYNFIFQPKSFSIAKQLIYLSLCIMTKSAAAFITLPIYFAAIFAFKNGKGTLKYIYLWTCASLIFLTYCLIREYIQAGYLDAIWANDFHGRFSKPLEGHTSQWYYYCVNLLTTRYSYFIYLLPVATFIGIKYKNRALNFFSLVLFLYLILLSIAKTRIHWYDTPLLPFIGIVISVGIHVFLNHHLITKRVQIITAVVCILFTVPLMIEKTEFITKHKGMVLDFGHYELSQFMRTYKGKDTVGYIANWYDAEFYFYSIQNPTIKRYQFNQLQLGNKVMMGNLYKDSLPIKYHFRTIDSSENAKIIEITGILP